MTTYAHKDENNNFVLKKWNKEVKNNPEAEVELVRNGDLVNQVLRNQVDIFVLKYQY